MDDKTKQRLLEKLGAVLTAKGRNQIKEKNFALDGSRYPIHDRSHARNALSRVAQHGTPEEQAKVRGAVSKKHTGIGKESEMNKEAKFSLMKSLKNSGIARMYRGALGPKDSSVREGLKKALVWGTGAAGLTAGIRGMDAGIDAIRTPLHKSKAFNDMMEDNPTLKKENPRDVTRIFNTLHTFNPVMAGDPLVAGSFMRRALQFKDEGLQPVDVKTLAEVRKLHSEGKRKETLLQSMFGSSLPG